MYELNSCLGSYFKDYVALTLPATTLVVSKQASHGTFAGDWQYGISMHSFGAANTIGPFVMCTNTSAAASPNSNGSDKNLYVGGEKPAAVIPAPGNLTVTEDSVTYPVFTTQQLQQLGLGYIVRWRVTNGFVNTGEFGEWVTPPSHNWNEHMPPASDGMPFWRFWIVQQTGNGHGHIQGYTAPTNVLNSLQDWYDILATRPAVPYVIWYGAQVATRFVLIQDPATIPAASALNPVIQTRTLQVELLRARPGSYSNAMTTFIVNQSVTVILPPTGSCTTPSVNPSTVNFGALFASDIPNPGNTANERNLNLTFTNCPRSNIGYYVHANGKWVDSAQGIVGISGSTPNANPAIGNPRGFGVQLAHGTGSPDGTGPVYISSHDTDPDKQIYWRTPAQGVNSNTGVTHTIPLRARVIRTHPSNTPIIPGGFNTSVVVAIQYP